MSLAPDHRLSPPTQRRVTSRRRRSEARALPPRGVAERIDGGTGLPAHLHGAVVALGNFDGFHLGHQAVVGRAVALARSRGVPAVVATFDPHPARHFRPDAAPFRLTSLEQRRRLLGPAGVDALMVCAFDAALADLTPAAFVDGWLRYAGGVVTGANYRFGRNRAGDVALLASLGAERGIICETAATIGLGDTTASSSRIRDALRLGDCGTASSLLTRPYTISATLRSGLRHDPGLPLIDASLPLTDYLRPRPGVYAVRGRLLDGRTLGGSAYLAPDEDTLELFLVDLRAADIGGSIAVEFLAHLHDAPRVDAGPALRHQIARDRDRGRRVAADVPA